MNIPTPTFKRRVKDNTLPAIVAMVVGKKNGNGKGVITIVK